MTHLRLKLRKNQSTLPLEKIGPETTGLEIISEGLSSLPKELEKLSKLHSLSIHCPFLSELPDWVFQFTELHILKLKNTPIRNLPEAAPRTPLRMLQISGCGIERLPEWIGSFNELTDLDLSRNQFSELPQSLGELHQLVRLNLDSNKLTGLPSSMDQLPRLNHLSLDNNAFPEEEQLRIQKAFNIWF